MSNTIWCVGRNYKDHAKEMNAEVPTSPLIFLKAWGCLTTTQSIKLPKFSNHIEHEIEIAIRRQNNSIVSSFDKMLTRYFVSQLNARSTSSATRLCRDTMISGPVSGCSY